MKKLLLLLLFTCCTACYIHSQVATLTPLLELDGAAITSISENGEWACGAAQNNADNAGYTSNASKWNLKTGERIYLVSEEESEFQSDAFCITNDGTLVGGQYLFEPAYHINGEWHTLSLPKGYTRGEVRGIAIVGSDTILVGRLFDGEGYVKVQSAKWVNGEFQKIVNLIPREYQYNEDKRMANQITGISQDGRIMLGAIDPMTWPLRKPFIIKDSVFTLLDIENRTEFEKFHANFDFFKEEKLSHDGKFIALTFFANMHIPCTYSVEDDIFTIIQEAPFETGCKAIDAKGNAYYAGPVTTGVDRKSYVTIDNKATCIDSILLNKFGITQEQINATCQDPDLTGSIRYIYDVASDGKTIIGSAGYGIGGYNWVLHLPYTLFEDVPDAIENIEYNNNIAFYNNQQINILGNANYIEIFNINGQLIESMPVENSIVQANLQQGIYLIKIYNQNQIITNKIIVK